MTYTQLLDQCWYGNAAHSDRVLLWPYFWKIGDPTPIAEWLGIEYIPPTISDDMDLDDELELIVHHARKWITAVHQRLYEPVAA